MWPFRVGLLLPTGVRKLSVEADFLTPLELHYPAVMDHELDGAIPDRAQGPLELTEERRRQRERVVCSGLMSRREGWVLGHDPI